MFNDPKLKDAFTKAIKHYFDDQDFEEYNKSHGEERKFSKKYFDTLEADLTTKPEEDKKTKRKKK